MQEAGTLQLFIGDLVLSELCIGEALAIEGKVAFAAFCQRYYRQRCISIVGDDHSVRADAVLFNGINQQPSESVVADFSDESSRSTQLCRGNGNVSRCAARKRGVDRDTRVGYPCLCQVDQHFADC